MHRTHTHAAHGTWAGGARFARNDHWDSPRRGRGEFAGPAAGSERGRRGSSGGGLGRFFAHGDLRLVVLALIAEKPRHGYEIIKAIEEQVAGAYSPSPGVVYPTLTLLEELGYVAVAPEAGGKKLHSITEQGQAFLAANRQPLEALRARIAIAATGLHRPPEIVAAMERLKSAIRSRLADGRASAAGITAIAAAIEEAATIVENTP